jgi:hypothetical protein
MTKYIVVIIGDYVYKKGLFDGYVKCKVIKECSHPNECIGDCKTILINRGNMPGYTC